MLTPRQREIAQLVARGMSYKAIARDRGIARRTVVNHVQDIARRIDAPGARPRDKVTIWVLTLNEPDPSV